jgi:transposase-like protein
MPWKEQREMDLKLSFVEKASQPRSNMSALCESYGISRETGYKWLNHFKREGAAGLVERSRRPRSAPLSTAEDVVMAVLEIDAHPRRGPKKLVSQLKSKLGDQTPSFATAPAAIPGWVRPALRPLARIGTRWFARKCRLRDFERDASLEQQRAALAALRAELQSAGRYLLGQFSYAGIAMATALQAVAPVADVYMRSRSRDALCVDAAKSRERIRGPAALA